MVELQGFHFSEFLAGRLQGDARAKVLSIYKEVMRNQVASIQNAVETPGPLRQINTHPSRVWREVCANEPSWANPLQLARPLGLQVFQHLSHEQEIQAGWGVEPSKHIKHEVGSWCTRRGSCLQIAWLVWASKHFRTFSADLGDTRIESLLLQQRDAPRASQTKSEISEFVVDQLTRTRWSAAEFVVFWLHNCLNWRNISTGYLGRICVWISGFLNVVFVVWIEIMQRMLQWTSWKWMDQACEIAHDRLLSVWDVVPTDGLSMVVWWKSLDGRAAVGKPTYQSKVGMYILLAEGWPMRSLRKSQCHLPFRFRLEDVAVLQSQVKSSASVSKSNLCCRVGSSARAPATNVPCLFACFIMVPWLHKVHFEWDVWKVGLAWVWARLNSGCMAFHTSI